MQEIEVTHAPSGLSTVDEWATFIDGWLSNRRLSENTREAYRRDLRQWLAYCDATGLAPLAATFVHVNTYARALESEGLSPASVARKLYGMVSLYDFLVKVGALAGNPARGADIPRVDRDHSSTVGLAAEEVDAILAAVRRPRDLAIMYLFADLGLRVSEVVNLDVESVAAERNHTVVEYQGKGGKPRRRALSGSAEAAVKMWLAIRPEVDSPALFVSTGGLRLDRHMLFRMVREYARLAGIPHWAKITPHSLRHAFATVAREMGVPLEDVQDAMGHVDPRTTRRYDRDRHNLDRDPSLTLDSARQRRKEGTS